MGTNFYCKLKITPEKHKTLQELLNSKKYQELQDTLVDYTKVYHIGKRSYGWQFLFAPHEDKYWNLENPWENTLQSIKDFLAREDVDIYDEYDKHFTTEEFWEEVNCCLYNDPVHYINGYQYKKRDPNTYIGTAIENTEFITKEGLRFSKQIDFS